MNSSELDINSDEMPTEVKPFEKFLSYAIPAIPVIAIILAMTSDKWSKLFP